jgi:glycosyltransferase involved in cell wall biosynthesis
MRTAIVIPAYNEAATLRDVAVRALAQAAHVIVIDDGSTDGTADRVAGLPVQLIRHVHNGGKAASLWDGFAAALRGGVDCVVTLDADGQHRPEDVPRLSAAAHLHPHRVIVGARLRNRAQAPRVRRVGNAFADFWLSWAAGHRIVDSQSGLRAYPAALLREIVARGRLRHDERASFTLESEMLIEAARLGYETVAVPIAALYFDGRASHFRNVRDTLRITRMVARRLLLAGMRPRGLWRCLTGRATVFATAPETAPGVQSPGAAPRPRVAP